MNNQANGRSLATVAMITGILTIVTAMLQTVFLPFLFGGLSITFACLSKDHTRMMTNAKVGLFCALGGMIVNVAIIVFAIQALINDPEIIRRTSMMYDQMYHEMYGESFESMYGQSFEDYMDDILSPLK